MAGSSQRQWLTIGVTTVAVAGALVGALALSHHGTGTGATAAGSPQHVLKPVVAAATTTTTTAAAATEPAGGGVIAQPPGPKSPATAATVVYRLTQLLPAGRTSGDAAASDGSVFGQIYLDRGHGPGMLRLDVYRTPAGEPRTCHPSNSGDLSTQCVTLPNGGRADITRIADNCIQSLVVDVDHGDGTGVQLNVGTCLAWNGRTNPPGPEALTEDEAIRIAADPSWGVTMDSSLVAAGASAFPHLPTFS